MNYPLCKKLGLLVSVEGYIYADKLEEVLRNTAKPLLLDCFAHDVIRADTNCTQEYMDTFSKGGYRAIMIMLEPK